MNRIPQFPVHSDPNHQLLLRTVGAKPGSEAEHSLYIKKKMKASQFGGTYEDYMMVQPAFVVVNRSGDVKQAWSWNTDELAEIEPKSEMKLVSAYGNATLVSVRPETTDIGPSIHEGRRVKLKGFGTISVIKEKFRYDNMFSKARCVVA